MSDIPIGPGSPGGFQASVFMTVEMMPSVVLILDGLDHWSENLEDTVSLLELLVDETMSPDIRQRFIEEGPGWAPLAEATIERKQGPGILWETGNLIDVASDPSIWEFEAEGDGAASAAVFNLPGAEYGIFHQTGTDFMPARQFLTITDDLMAKLDNAFGDWVDLQTLEGGFFN